MTTQTCPHCGSAMPHPSVRAVLPDAVLDRSEECWHANSPDPGRADFMWAEFGGRRHWYLRAVIDLDARSNVCLWVETDRHSWRHIRRVWNDPGPYLASRVEGMVANSVPPWGDDAQGARVTLRPKSADKLPYVIATDNPLQLYHAGGDSQ